MDGANNIYVYTDGRVVYDGEISGIYFYIEYRPVVTNTGYKRVCIKIDGTQKSLLVHRLVALAFVPTIIGCNLVNHIDGNKLHNGEIGRASCRERV